MIRVNMIYLQVHYLCIVEDLKIYAVQGRPKSG